MRKHSTLAVLFVILSLTFCGFAFPFGNGSGNIVTGDGNITGHNNHHNNIYGPGSGSTAEANAEALGIGVGIGVGGDAEVSNYNTDVNVVDIEIDNEDYIFNCDYVSQGQGQHQGQGQQQKLVNKITNPRQFGAVAGPMNTGEFLAPTQLTGIINDAWFMPDTIGLYQTEEAMMSGWKRIFGAKVRKKKMTPKDYDWVARAEVWNRDHTAGPEVFPWPVSEKIGIITVIGTYGTPGWEAETYAYEKLMKMGANKLVIVSFGVKLDAVGASIGGSPTITHQKVHGKFENYNTAGAAGGLVNLGWTAAVGKPFITVIGYR